MYTNIGIQTPILKTKMIMLCILRQYKWTKTETIEFVDLGEKILSNAINKTN